MKKESKVRFEQNNEQIVQKVETKQKQNLKEKQNCRQGRRSKGYINKKKLLS